MKSSRSSSTRPPFQPLPEAQLRAVADLFTVLGEPTRLRILQLLEEEGAATVGSIAETLDLKQPNASKQLGVLHKAGVLARERDGNAVRYSIAMPLVFELCELVCGRLRQDAEHRARAMGA